MKDINWMPIAQIAIPSIIAVLIGLWQVKTMRAIANPIETPQKPASTVAASVKRVIKANWLSFTVYLLPFFGLIFSILSFPTKASIFGLIVNSLLISNNLTVIVLREHIWALREYNRMLQAMLTFLQTVTDHHTLLAESLDKIDDKMRKLRRFRRR
jgi:hypothetical protein